GMVQAGGVLQGGNPLHERMGEGLRLRVDQVETLEDDEERLVLALADEKEAHRLDGLLAAAGDFHGSEGMILGEAVKEPEERWNAVLQAFVECEHAARDLGADGARIGAAGGLEVTPAQATEREVWSVLPAP